MPLIVAQHRHPATAHFAPLFAFDHLQDGLVRQTSEAFTGLAQTVIDSLPDGPELTAGLRKLLEAKDCCVRQAVLLNASLTDPMPVMPGALVPGAPLATGSETFVATPEGVAPVTDA